MLDKLLAPVAWLIAASLALMLLVGPQVIAEDKPDAAAGAAPYATSGGSVDGKAVFTERCGSCHTLAAAGTTGQVGPVLDSLDRDAGEVEEVVRAGRGAMPSFEGDLSDDEIAAVAAFVTAAPQ